MALDSEYIGFSAPNFLDNERFMVALFTNEPQAKIYLQVYELDRTHPFKLPRKVQAFRLPLMHNVSIDSVKCASRAMSPTYTNMTIRCQSPTSAFIYDDHEQLCQIIISNHTENFDIVSFSVIVYLSTFLNKHSTLGFHMQSTLDDSDILWEDWGANNAACFLIDSVP